ncbi:MAG: hypothetical protein BWY99_02393 [Synergistetes bacterium ADurb.BinA166]|nr:MAG: hypothetical protein BWY99_02393 [Synergistetes bacterium ADurb.BinA166]
MEGDEPHALEHPRLDPGRDLVLHLAVGHVAPPDQDVRPRENLGRQAVLRLVERRGRRGDPRLLPEVVRDDRVHPLRVDLPDRLLVFHGIAGRFALFFFVKMSLVVRKLLLLHSVFKFRYHELSYNASGFRREPVVPVDCGRAGAVVSHSIRLLRLIDALGYICESASYIDTKKRGVSGSPVLGPNKKLGRILLQELLHSGVPRGAVEYVAYAAGFVEKVQGSFIAAWCDQTVVLDQHAPVQGHVGRCQQVDRVPLSFHVVVLHALDGVEYAAPPGFHPVLGDRGEKLQTTLLGKVYERGHGAVVLAGLQIASQPLSVFAHIFVHVDYFGHHDYIAAFVPFERYAAAALALSSLYLKYPCEKQGAGDMGKMQQQILLEGAFKGHSLGIHAFSPQHKGTGKGLSCAPVLVERFPGTIREGARTSLGPLLVHPSRRGFAAIGGPEHVSPEFELFFALVVRGQSAFQSRALGNGHDVDEVLLRLHLTLLLRRLLHRIHGFLTGPFRFALHRYPLRVVKFVEQGLEALPGEADCPALALAPCYLREGRHSSLLHGPHQKDQPRQPGLVLRGGEQFGLVL